MPVLTPNVFLGRNITSLTLTAQDVAADGTLSNNSGGAKSIQAQLRSVRNKQTNELENVSGIMQRRRNNVILESGTTYTISGFLLAGDSVATPTNPIETLCDGFDYLKMIFTRNGRAVTYYGLIHDYETNVEGKGSVSFTLELEMVDPGSTNPVSA